MSRLRAAELPEIDGQLWATFFRAKGRLIVQRPKLTGADFALCRGLQRCPVRPVPGLTVVACSLSALPSSHDQVAGGEDREPGWAYEHGDAR